MDRQLIQTREELEETAKAHGFIGIVSDEEYNKYRYWMMNSED